MGRRRAIALVVVHALVALHIAHYLATGATISPLEPSEAGHSLRTGAINAGAIFFCLLLLSTLVFGRFFCGWACHVVAYQDLARWILIKIGLRPQPIRARLLMLVPLFAVYWLYGRPLVARFGADQAAAGLSFHVTTDDFWATFPGPAITILTFLLCGFLVVYFLGAKGFCTYGCPYGALFGITDRFARGRIRVNEDCAQTGQCTRTCSSNVDVAREVNQFGMVIDPGCMKCMDCVAGCPNDALSFGFGSKIAPAKTTTKRPTDGRLARRSFDFTWTEEVLLVAAFAGLFWVYFNLYRTIPFLMAIGLCVIGAFLFVVALRLPRVADVSLQRMALKRNGRWTGAGRGFAVIAVLLLLMTAHCGVVQWHTRQGVAAFERAQVARVEGRADAFTEAAAAASSHLETGASWGVFYTRGFGRMRGEIHRWQGDPRAALVNYDEELAHSERNPAVPMFRGLALLELGRIDDAQESLQRAFGGSAPPRDRFLQLDWELGRMFDAKSAETRDVQGTSVRLSMLRLALQHYPGDGDIALKLCRFLLRDAAPAHREPEEALRIAEAATEAGGRTHADLLAMLAWLYDDAGRPDDAVRAAADSVRAATEQGVTDLAAGMTQALETYRRRAASPSEPDP